MPEVDELKLRLLESDEGFSHLAAQHRDLEQQLDALSSKPYLNESDQLAVKALKKRKLQLKDQMEEILRHHRQVPAGAPPEAASSAPAARS